MAWSIKKDRKTKKIENGDQYILIQALNQGDKDEMLDHLIQMDVGSLDKSKLKQGDASGAKMQLGAMRHFQRVRSIKEWNLYYTNDDGSKEPIPLNEQSIKNLPAEVVKEIDAAVQELNPMLDDEKKSE